MNKYPAWLKLALPNIYGSVPAVQIADNNGVAFDDARLQEYVETVEAIGVTPEAAYLQDGRAVLRFEKDVDLTAVGEKLKDRYGRTASIMKQAVASRLQSYEQDFSDRLRTAKIRHRVELVDQVIRIRLTSSDDMETAREVVQKADPDLLVADGADEKSLTVRMSDAQIKARRDFAIDQNVTTLRNRVDQLGVAEPLVQRQGEDRIVLQLPGVDDPNKISEIITATATIEFRLVDQSGDEPGSRRYQGRGSEPSAVLKRRVIASGDQIINAAVTNK